VLNTAVDDELITRNPCRIKGAGTERAAERPTATVAQVFDLAGHTPARFRVLVLLAAFTSTVATIGLPGFHFHDLRHTGNTLASRTGVSLADLMARTGHSSARAALIYQHTAQAQDKIIADGLSAHIARERDRARNGHGKRKNRSA
jgi:integrase